MNDKEPHSNALKYALVGFILVGYIANEYDARQTTIRFFEDMRAHHSEAEHIYGDVQNFMLKGGRNTADQGYHLCQRVVAIEGRLGIPHDINCEDIYFNDRLD